MTVRLLHWLFGWLSSCCERSTSPTAMAHAALACQLPFGGASVGSLVQRLIEEASAKLLASLHLDVAVISIDFL